MALSVNINVPSINAQRRLAGSSNTLGTTLERLSSGLRINKAADDAAGMAISTNLTALTRGLTQASRNAGDGLSLLGTAESSISEQTNILQRLRELAVQSASDTNSASNRSALNDEGIALIAEFERIARTTEFNGVKLLDGTFAAKELQVGANATGNDRIAVNLSSSRAADVGSAYELTSSGAVSGTLDAGELSITVGSNSFSVGAAQSDGVSTDAATASALAYADAVNAISDQTGVKATATTSYINAVQDNTDNTDTNGAGVIVAGALKINGINVGATTLSGAGGTEIRDAINAITAETGVSATLASNNKLTLTAADGRNIKIEASAGAAVISGLAAGTHRGTVKMTSSTQFSIANAATELNMGASATAAQNSNNVSTIDLTTKANAQTAIDTVDTALSMLNSTRSYIGAQTNRLNTAISNLSAAVENSAAANSRILDADFAAETANLTRAQILQQAGVSILAQANQLPQIALSLLGG